MVSDTHNEPTSPPLPPFSSSLGPDLSLTTPTTTFCYIVERVWPMRHVDRVKVGSGNTKEDRTPGAGQIGKYELKIILVIPDCAPFCQLAQKTGNTNNKY